ncbi:MAG: pyrroline-5-carboxylate reductase family protein [Solirubrobacterales bacterium]
MIVGFAGAGNMAAAMARGWAGAEGGPRMLFCDLDRERAAALAAEVEGEVRDSLPALAADSEVVLLAVKPAALDDVAEQMGHRAPALLSVMAATPTSRLAEAFPAVPALRVMPNQPVEVRRGVICHPPAVAMPEELETRLLNLLEALGSLFELPEEQIETAMAVMSCAPAYAAVFAGALAGAGAAEGLDPHVSLELVAETLAGTAEMLAHRGAEEIESAVAPPGGATEAGLDALRDRGFEEAIAAAVAASLERFR